MSTTRAALAKRADDELINVHEARDIRSGKSDNAAMHKESELRISTEKDIHCLTKR